MFGRLLLQLLRGSRGRLAVALIAIVSGAAVISALLNLDLDVGSKLTQEFRSLGANVVIAPRQPQGKHAGKDECGRFAERFGADGRECSCRAVAIGEGSANYRGAVPLRDCPR